MKKINERKTTYMQSEQIRTTRRFWELAKKPGTPFNQQPVV
jgi:hypothetical protein